MPIAEVVYRVLGVVAPINQRLSRVRLNFIPANLLLMIVLGVGVFTSWNAVVRVMKSRRAPVPQTVREFNATRHFSGTYVAVEGRLVANARIDIGKQAPSGSFDMMAATFAPLEDRAGGRAILVQLAGDRSPANEDVVVQGVLRPMAPAVSRQLSQKRYLHAGIPIERGLMLVEGRQPGSLSAPLRAGGLCAIALLALIWAAVTRNVIFMPDDRVPVSQSSIPATPGDSPLVSGTFAFDAKTRRFFTHMPATIGRSDAGDTTLVSHVETSRTTFGIKQTEHSGLWAVAIRPGSLTEMQAGHVFWGLRKLRAVQFRYVNAFTGASERLVVASAANDPRLLLQGEFSPV